MEKLTGVSKRRISIVSELIPTATFFLKHFMPFCTVQFFDYLEPLNFLRLFGCYQVKIYFRSDFCMQHVAATYLYMNACLILNSYLQIEKVIF